MNLNPAELDALKFLSVLVVGYITRFLLEILLGDK